MTNRTRTFLSSALTPLLLSTSFCALLSSISMGCVSDRPSRNSVFNENQYIRKSFLIREGDGSTQDTGWLLKSTVVASSSPNPLAGFNVEPGLTTTDFVRFEVTSDHMNMLSARALSNVPSEATIPEIENAWPIANVDLKYHVNLDGETTNLYEENQELDWQVRQWVKLNFAKNDSSDFAPFGSGLNDTLERCVDFGNASSTLVPGSFLVDEPNDYLQWEVSLALPIKLDDDNCTQVYGGRDNAALLFGRQGTTIHLMYSLIRAKPLDSKDYQPLSIEEKDPIRHKYAPLEQTLVSRDPNTGLLAAEQLVTRLNPNKEAVWYFNSDFPQKYKDYWKTTIKQQTNALFAQTGANIRVDFKDYDEDLAPGQSPRQFGDIRYHFLRWMNDRDSTSGWWGATWGSPDPRTGEHMGEFILFAEGYNLHEYLLQEVQSYLLSTGACPGYDATTETCPASSSITDPTEWPDQGACTPGDTLPLVPAAIISNHNGTSSLYTKMQQYLHKPQATFGPLGPQDFIKQADDDFNTAYYTLMPYWIFADPDRNQFVTREGGKGTTAPEEFWGAIDQERQFQEISAQIDQGITPFPESEGGDGLESATQYMNQLRTLSSQHHSYTFDHSAMSQPNVHLDGLDPFTMVGVAQKSARHCQADGTWETKAEWIQHFIDSFWYQTFFHEFGHALGLQHNFMGSIDKPNFPLQVDANGKTLTDQFGNPKYALYSSSVMEYGIPLGDDFVVPGWGPYDKGALGFLYANNQKDTTLPMGTSISGQSGGGVTTPRWKDPYGFTTDASGNSVETQFLSCYEIHEKYTPFCRTYDFGTTPSEIIANQIEQYETSYKFRNFRQYRKFWDDSAYANVPAGLIGDMRRFLSVWAFDWSTGEIADTLRRVGFVNPSPTAPNINYFDQLGGKFTNEISTANQLSAAFHKAVINQSAGERPFATIYDKYYGDVTQQGIVLDKVYAMQQFTALWVTDNYDQNQAGSYLAYYQDYGDPTYLSVAEDAVTSMLGGQYDVYPWVVPAAIAQFAQDTHSTNFQNNVAVRDWIGGAVFTRFEDFLAYFRKIAVDNGYTGDNCSSFDTCLYDPTQPGISDAHDEFTAPDGRVWIWTYVNDRHTYLAVQKERNTASYIIVRSYNDDVVYAHDDGAYPGTAYSLERQMKFLIDAYLKYNTSGSGD